MHTVQGLFRIGLVGFLQFVSFEFLLPSHSPFSFEHRESQIVDELVLLTGEDVYVVEVI